MRRNNWKILLVIGVVAFSIWKAYPPLDMVDSEGNVTEGKVNLGLDLQGGVYMVLEVDASELPEEAKKDATDRAITTIRNRIDRLGLKEPLIQKVGLERIIIQLPGETNRERAIEIVNQVAHLEFRLVSDDAELQKKVFDGEEAEGYELLSVKDRESGRTRQHLVSTKIEMTGEHMTSAEVDFDQQGFGEPYVKFSLDKEGAVLFRDITQNNLQKQLAIVLDGNLISAPVIQTVIPNGEGRITGSFSRDAANSLAIVLESGSLPAPVNILEERTVGPTLGRDSIEKGIKAIIIGGICVVLFMALYYLLCGFIADFALFLNVIIITGALAYFGDIFGAALTLPGIAGLVLTIGMAVDANVLIFERIREESNLGKSIRIAIQSGFKKAFITILDSNITTFIAAFVLFQFGTGPVKGFATILMIGIVSSMFTALLVTRLVLDLLTTGSLKLSKLSMLRLIHQPKINFIAFRKIAYILSLALIAWGLFSFNQRGEDNYNIDFTGGTIQQLKFENPVDAEDIRDVLKGIGLASASIQHFGNDKEIIIRSLEMEPRRVMDSLKKAFRDNKFEIMRVEKVGPSVGKDLRGKAIRALLIAMLFMVVYISIRFEFRFAAAAIIALLHDLLISIGAISLTGRQISAPVIAALLTIVGYSINDTIVVFDRIREDRRIMRKSDRKTIINTSINQTISRTILTSLTTLLVVLALYFLGGEVINDFAFVLLIGILVGTYSSIFIASPILVDWPGRK